MKQKHDGTFGLVANEEADLVEKAADGVLDGTSELFDARCHCVLLLLLLLLLS